MSIFDPFFGVSAIHSEQQVTSISTQLLAQQQNQALNQVSSLQQTNLSALLDKTKKDFENAGFEKENIIVVTLSSRDFVSFVYWLPKEGIDENDMMIKKVDGNFREDSRHYVIAFKNNEHAVKAILRWC